MKQNNGWKLIKQAFWITKTGDPITPKTKRFEIWKDEHNNILKKFWGLSGILLSIQFYPKNEHQSRWIKRFDLDGDVWLILIEKNTPIANILIDRQIREII